MLRKTLRVRILVLVFSAFIFLNTSLASAALMYDFVESWVDDPNVLLHDTTLAGQVLATLGFSSLPATHNQVLGLSFSADGDSIFGLGVGTYSGTFTNSIGLIVSDGSDGLIGSEKGSDVFLISADPPPSSLFGPGNNLDLFFYSPEDLPAHLPGSVPRIFYAKPEGGYRIAFGYWRQAAGDGDGGGSVVPEPASLVVWGGLGLIGLVAGWRRRRAHPVTAA